MTFTSLITYKSITMKTTVKHYAMLVVLLITSVSFAQKKVQSFTVSHTINTPIEKAWEVIGEDYGGIHKSHHKVITSSLINGSTKAELNCERVCNFNDSKTKYIKEKIVAFDPENHTMKIDIFEVNGFPIDPDYSYAIQRLEPINATSCKMVMDFHYRTKPGFLSSLAKGNFKKQLKKYAIAIEHYATTNEPVTKDNFKAIQKTYQTTK